MKIAVLLPDLRPGGAERVHLQLARQWQSEGICVDFVLRVARGELLGEIPAGARVVELNAARVRNSLWPLVRYLRTERPDALLAAMWPLTVIAPVAARLAGFQGRVVVSEHAPQSLAYAHRGRGHSILMRASMRLGYRLASGCVGVSSGVADDMARLAGMPRDRINVIHNPAAVGGADGPRPARPVGLGISDGPIILSVGTLKPVKRHDVLIRAFAQAAIPGAELHILGEGEQRAVLESLVSSLGLHGRVFLQGFQANTAPWYANADLFVLSSDHEGFGNVIVEALEHGTPVVSTDCPSGPREILANGRFGRLVPVNDFQQLALAMREALAESHDVEALRSRARDFGVQKASAEYLGLLLPGFPEGGRP